MFPGYVLINMIMNDDTWYVVRNTRGVTGFVGPGSKPVPLTDEEMVNLGITGGDENVELDLEVGDAVVRNRRRMEGYSRTDSVVSTIQNRWLPSMLSCSAAKRR